jgi:crotonobetainyl-CoA:carnitine CoA-transferase CaiB-like acyl-CoA transferase
MSVLAQVIDAPELAKLNDEGDTFTHRDRIYAVTRERLQHRATAEWLAAFEAADAWAGPVYGYADVVNDPQIQHNGTFVEYDHPTEGRVKTPGFAIRFSKTPSRVERGAPVTGQHTREILSEIGWSQERIDALLQAKVIGEEKL